MRTHLTKALVFFVASSLCLVASAQTTPLDATKALIENFKSVKRAKKGQKLSAADRAANAAVFAKLDGRFAFERITAEAIRPHKSQLTADQLGIYTKTFRALIRMVSYPDSGGFFRKATYKLADAGSAKVNMEANLEEEDIDLEVTFHWAKIGATYKLVDVSFDGDSLVSDYQNQFGRILKKKGADAFVKKFQERHQKELAARGAAE
jgi:ABC-type transporter MlaC component